MVDRFFNHVSNRSESIRENAFVRLCFADRGYDVGPGRRVFWSPFETRPGESITDGIFAVDWHIFFKDLRGYFAGFRPFYFAKINIDTDYFGAQDG